MTSEQLVGGHLLLLLLCLFLLGKDVDSTCELDSVPPCPPGWILSRNPEMCMEKFRGPFPAAIKTCEDLNATLMLPQTKELSLAIRDVMSRKFQYYMWIGLNMLQGRHYSWPGTSATLFLNWAPDANQTEKCVTMDSMTYQYYDFDCEEKFAFVCYKSDSSCPPRYFKNTEYGYCLRIEYSIKTRADAQSHCAKDGTNLMNIQDRTTFNGLKEIVVRNTRSFVYLTDLKTETVWVWGNGAPNHGINWRPQEPSDSRGENCAGMDKLGTFLDWACSSHHPYLCQKESRTGPSEVKMDVTYNKLPDTVFRGTMFNAECSAFNTESGTFTWILDGTRSSMTFSRLGATIRDTYSLEEKKDGTCANKTTTKISFPITQAHHGMRFSCYAYDVEYDPNKICSQERKKESFCDISKIIKVEDIPKGVRMKPIIFHEPANIVYGNTTFSISCVEIESAERVLQWKVNGPSMTMQNLEAGQVDYTQVARKSGYSVNETTSTITFNVTEDVHDMVLSCHKKGSKVTSCATTQRDLDVCDRTPPLQVVIGAALAPPTLKVAYKGFPGPIYVGDTMKVTCEVYHGGKGTLIWVVYFPEGPQAINYNDLSSEIVKKHSQIMDDKGTRLTSQIEVDMPESMSNLSVACFAYDILKYKPETMECDPGEIFCIVSGNITVTTERILDPPSESGSTWSWFWWIVLFLLVVFTCVMLWPIEADLYGGECEAEADIRVSVTVSETGKRREKVQKLKKNVNKQLIRTRTIVIAFLIRKMTQAKKLKKRVAKRRKKRDSQAIQSQPTVQEEPKDPMQNIDVNSPGISLLGRFRSVAKEARNKEGAVDPNDKPRESTVAVLNTA